MIKRSLGLLLVAVLLGAGLSTIAGAAPTDHTAAKVAISGDQTDGAFLVPQGSPTPSATATPAPSPTSTEQPKKCPPKKGKGKKKKKGCPPQKPAAPACPAYTPGEQGAELPVNLVTDAHTADAPLEVTVATEAGFVAEVPMAFQNIQVDTASAETGLHAAFEFEIFEDYDIYLNNPDGSEAARAAGFNPFPFVPGETDGTGNGGHSEQGAEYLDGIRTADCGGYTLQIDSFLAEGGDRTLNLWLGEATYPE
ncbi:MAG: hypothetical protein ABR505_08030 [Actinomycetota bacterium]